MNRIAQIIALVNQKGGPGKTTLTMHLAGALARRGAKVLIVDADPQATATRWAATAPDETPFPAAVASLGNLKDRLHREIRKFIGDYDYLIIDCPPSADSPISQSALLVANLALVPVIPSPPDLWAGIAIRQVLQTVEAVNEGLQARLLINQRKPGTRLAGKTLELLPQIRHPNPQDANRRPGGLPPRCRRRPHRRRPRPAGRRSCHRYRSPDQRGPGPPESRLP